MGGLEGMVVQAVAPRTSYLRGHKTISIGGGGIIALEVHHCT